MENRKINFLFNLGLFLIIAAPLFIEGYTKADISIDFPISDYLPYLPKLSLIMAQGFFIAFLVPAVIALFFKVFWNRLINDIFNLRIINFQEALSVVLISMIMGR